MKFIILLFILMPLKINALEASSYIAMDINNLSVIEEYDKDKIRSVASISKIMTAILAIENNDVNKKVIVGEEINESYGSGIYIKIGEQLSIKDLLYGLMLRSGNDAALVLAKNTGGTIDKFIDMMNNKAVEIGMKNSTFNNPSGLEVNNGNLSTAYDMALLTSYAMKNDIYKEIVSTKKYLLNTNMNNYVWYNKNKLLHKYNFITGGKTGYTEKAKRTLVTTGSKNDINLVIVTLNDGNDFLDHVKLYNKIFNNYSNYKILTKGNLHLLNEHYNEKLYLKNDYSVTLPNSDYKVLLNYKIFTKPQNNLIGLVEIFINDKKYHEENIYLKKEKNDK